MHRQTIYLWLKDAFMLDNGNQIWLGLDVSTSCVGVCLYEVTNDRYGKIHELTQRKLKSDKRIKFVGTVYDQELLKKIRENAYAYFHGHTVGGTNPSLIEALGSTDLNLLVDVGFNKEVAEDCALYWSRKPGSLAKLIDKADQMSADEIAELGRKAKKRVAEEYTWEKICGQYEDVFVK